MEFAKMRKFFSVKCQMNEAHRADVEPQCGTELILFHHGNLGHVRLFSNKSDPISPR